MSFYQSGQPIIIPDPVDVGVQTVVAGSNVTITGTATVPIVNVVTGANGPSANNIPIPSGAPGAPVTVTPINNGAQANFYTIATALLPQDASGSKVYRFTFNGFFETAIITGGTGGNITVFTTIQPANQVICGVTMYANSTFSPTGNIWSMSGIFIPTVGDSLQITVRNSTGGTLTNCQVVPTTKGCGIELVSSSSAPQLIFS
jgi:hypothetical protein